MSKICSFFYVYLCIKMKVLEMDGKNNKNKTIQIKYICYNKQAPRVWLKKNEKKCLKKHLHSSRKFDILFRHCSVQNAPVAQLDRAFDYESKGCEFDSCPAHHIHRDVAQLGSALDLGSRGHRFESCHPDHVMAR